MFMKDQNEYNEAVQVVDQNKIVQKISDESQESCSEEPQSNFYFMM